MTIKHQKSSGIASPSDRSRAEVRARGAVEAAPTSSDLSSRLLQPFPLLLSIYNMSASEESTNGHSSFPFEESFDLEQYISHYTSETRLQRLAFIAQQTTDATLQQTANRMLEHDVKRAGNLVRYKQLHPQEDEHWIQTTTANNEASLQVLEARLSAAQANLNKDAIRTAFLNLADFSLKTGQVRDALKYTLRARDYCTSRQQTGLICWNVIELALNLCMYCKKYTGVLW